MTTKSVFLLTVTAMLIGIFIHAFGQTTDSSLSPWLEPENPNRLEWLTLKKQADEGENEFGEDGVEIHFYLSPESYRTGVILCELLYLPNVTAELLQMIEDGIQERFKVQRRADPWARVKIIRKVAKG